MASEIRKGYTTAKTVDGCVLDPAISKVWYPVGEVWETWGTGSRTRADYAAISMSEIATGYYVGDFPTEITTEGKYDIVLTDRAGVNPANADTVIDTIEIIWSGSAAAEEEVVEETVTSICQYAISKIGGGIEAKFTISSIYDKTDTANLCLQLYPQIRKEVLCRAWWAEATKYADLGGELSGVEKADWEYAFNLPSDYLGKCKQINEDYQRSTKPEYLVEYDKEIVQGKLFTNEYTNSDNDSAYIKYIFNLTDVSKFSTLLLEAIATKLATELSTALLADKGMRRMQLLQEYEDLVLPLAIGENYEQQGDNTDDGEYTAITCRIP